VGPHNTSKRITEIEFAPERATSAVDGGVGLCALTSSLRTPTELVALVPSKP